MLEPLTGLMLTKADYESLSSSEACREPLFPSWIEWNKLQMRAAGAALKQGANPLPWTIDVAAYRTWCASVATTPCIDELRTYCQKQGVRLPPRLAASLGQHGQLVGGRDPRDR